MFHIIYVKFLSLFSRFFLGGRQTGHFMPLWWGMGLNAPSPWIRQCWQSSHRCSGGEPFTNYNTSAVYRGRMEATDDVIFSSLASGVPAENARTVTPDT